MESNIVRFRFLSQPSDVNFVGKVHGGAVMKWIDQAGVIPARSIGAANTVFNVYVGGIRFINPIRIGEIVEVQARIIYTGRTSMHIAVMTSKAINPKTKEEQRPPTA